MTQRNEKSSAAWLDAADQRRDLPFHQNAGLRDYQQRDSEVLQLHIRAMVAAIGEMRQVLETPPKRSWLPWRGRRA